MKRKSSPQFQKTTQTNPSKNQRQSIEFSAFIKRESAFFSSWKDKYALIVYLPNQEFSLTLYNKDKRTLDEIINLNLTKISKKCSTIELKFCFGLQMSSGRRYLIGGQSKEHTLAAFQLLTGIKKTLKQKSQLSTSKDNSQVSNKIQAQQLQFQKSNESQQDRQRQRQEWPKIQLKQKPLNATEQLQFQREQQKVEIIAIERQDDYCTVLEEDPIVIQQQQPLHLKMPLDSQQLGYLQSDENFKLLQTFNEGRILQKGKRFIKANLLFKTHLTSQQLLESFFHMQLWNQKVKNYKLLNRIDEGIYVIELELNKIKMFSYPRVCYMMVITLMMKNQPYLIMRSLQQSSFQKHRGKQWINLAIWLKVRGQDSQKLYKLVSLCASAENQKDFQSCLSFIQEVKCYQSFLKTTIKPPNSILQWRKQENQYIVQ